LTHVPIDGEPGAKAQKHSISVTFPSTNEPGAKAQKYSSATKPPPERQSIWFESNEGSSAAKLENNARLRLRGFAAHAHSASGNYLISPLRLRRPM
jgi:hypothetical protein